MEIIKFSKKNIRLSFQDILRHNNMPENEDPGEVIRKTISQALELFHENAEPSAIVKKITKSQFEKIFNGKGLNSSPSPLEKIYPQSDFLYLFVVTTGNRLKDLIHKLMLEEKLSLSYLLDSVASAGVEKYADHLDSVLFSRHYKNEENDEKRILRYSPGYCGWDISSQKYIFDLLKPEHIGVKLSDSCIMIPPKTISGVSIIGNIKIHIFKNNFSFCKHCKTFSCRDRIKIL